MAKGRKTGGRARGVPNKATASAKAALIDAFDKLGGVPALVKWGKEAENRGEFYKLWAKIIPQEIAGAGGGPLVVAVRFSNE